MLRKFCLVVTCILSAQFLMAQVGTGSLQGTLTDRETGEPLPFVNVVVMRGDAQIGGGSTDFDGRFNIRPLTPGEYNVVVSAVGYQSVRVTGVVVNVNRITFEDISMEPSTVQMDEFEVIEYSIPLIVKDGGPSGGTVNREDIARMPGRSAVAVAATVGGVQTDSDGESSIRGARAENTWYYIDGVKVRGTTRLPKAAIQEVNVLTGGIPASYGDVTGGVVSITTRGATNTWFGSVDVLSSGFRYGEDSRNNFGLDPYAQTQVEGVISGPLLFRKDSLGNRDRPILGFFLSANYRNEYDPRPSAVGNPYITDEVRERLLNDPIRFNFTDEIGEVGTGVIIQDGVPVLVPPNPVVSGIYNASYLREGDWVIDKARRNASIEGINLSSRLDIATTPNVDLAIGGRFDYNDQNLYTQTATNYANSMLNYRNNSVIQRSQYSIWGRFTQRFKTDENSGIKNAFYSIQADYSNRTVDQFDRNHRDDVFSYGYVGKFIENFTPNYQLNPDTLNGAWIHEGFRATGVDFIPSDVNSDLAAVNSQLFDFYAANGFNINSLSEIRSANGLLNGDPLPNVYNIWNNIGQPSNTYLNYQQSQFRVMATGSVDIGNHAISLGAEYEQLTEREYNLAPRGLWTIARQLTNFHIEEVDYANLIGTDYYQGGTYLTFGRRIGDDQTYFDASLREMLGLPVDGDDYINLDGLDPESLSLDMFSADELLNQGNNYVSYYGYDHTGKKLSGKPSFEDFFNQRGEDGQLTRAIGAFQPNYIAGYIMDKFAFDDIIFNVGVRVDRFDANQYVLKDEYIVGEHYTVGNNPTFSDMDHPSNIGNDFAIYVDRFENPTEILGYRDGDNWFNSQGVPVAEPAILRTSTGITPYLVNRAETGENLSINAFERYKPQVNVMPRISFSFPISDEATFFAHYDILTQRPVGNNRLNPIDYLYMQNRSNVVTNPNLRPTKTTDYELGFQQVLSPSSSLKISAFYRSVQDEINVRALVEAWPRQYITFSNQDFGTIKGLTLTYDLRRTGNVSLRANYTLQFASATGSNANSGINLANSGDPALRVISPTDRDQRHVFIVSLDYRYREGSDYNGPIMFGRQILANAGMNVVGNLGSGTPYSQQSTANGAAGITSLGGGTSLEGQINGSRMASQFTLNVQFDKSFTLTLKKKEGEKDRTANLNVYLLINNLLNTKNIIDVYRFTGNPDDDGFLQANEFRQLIESQIDPESFRQLYTLKSNDPAHFGLARTIQLGVRFDF